MQRRSGHDGHYRELVRGWFRGKTLNQLAYERSWFRQGLGIGYAVYPGDRVFWKLTGVGAHAPKSRDARVTPRRLRQKRMPHSKVETGRNPRRLFRDRWFLQRTR